MDADTEHQNSTTASDEKVHEEKKEKLNHDGQLESNGLAAGEPINTEEISAVSRQKRRRKSSVPVWRLVSASITVHAVPLNF